MAKYKILAPTQLKNKVVAEYGYIADEIELHGNAEELEKKGFIQVDSEEVKREETQEIEEVQVVSEEVKPGKNSKK